MLKTPSPFSNFYDLLASQYWHQHHCWNPTLNAMERGLNKNCEILVLVQGVEFTNCRAFHKSNWVKLDTRRDAIPSFLGHQPIRVTLDGNFKKWCTTRCFLYCILFLMSHDNSKVANHSFISKSLLRVWMLGIYYWPSLSMTAWFLIEGMVHLFNWGIYIDI